MDEDLLEEYVDRPVVVYFAPALVSAGSAASAEGKLHTYSSSGIVLEQERNHLLYIPLSAVRMVQIRPRPTFWEWLSGA